MYQMNKYGTVHHTANSDMLQTAGSKGLKWMVFSLSFNGASINRNNWLARIT